MPRHGLKQLSLSGLWLLGDNGYPKWRCIQMPDNLAQTLATMLFAEALESARKDIECGFGIVKVRTSPD